MLERLPFFRVRARLLASLLAAGAVLYSSLAPALGLGDITLRSSLNQPFKADIELLDTAGIDESDLTVTLASSEEFERAGIERLFFLNELRFTPDLRGSRKVIRVTSSKAVTEPFLTFLVQVSRPNGQLLRAFTVLLDPPGTGPRLPDPDAQPARTASRQAPAAAPPAAPVALPPSTQNKRYTVSNGDSLWTIAKQLVQAGTPMPINDLVRAVRALNPDSAPLNVGQSLLLPDAAVLPGATAAGNPSAAAPAADATQAAANAAADQQQQVTAVLNTQLQKNLDELQGRLQGLEQQIAERDQHVADLQARLAETPTQPLAAVPAAPAAAQPAPAPAPAGDASSAGNDSPGAIPAPIAVQPVDPDAGMPWLLIGALLAVLLLVLALLLARRRRQAGVQPAAEPLEPVLVKPAQVSAQEVAVADTVKPATQSLSARVNDVASRRDAPAATDALDGASIYIAYGRFNEALGILREGIVKSPDRTDLRVRLLEVLGQQGDGEAFAEEEAALLANGYNPDKLRDIRARFPKLAEPAPKAVEPRPPAVPAAAAVAAVAAVATPAVSEPEAPEQPPVAAAPDEFQLNLDDLSMDADWELVSPFEAPPPPRTKLVAEEAPEFDLAEPEFATNLKEFPEVLELQDEQFLSDFADVDEPLLQVENNRTPAADGLDDDFLDSFIADADLPELDALTVDFDSLESQHASAQTLEQAQALADNGDFDRASELLRGLLRDGDESCKVAARDLLSRIT